MRKQLKDAAPSQNGQFARVTTLEAENSALREKHEPQPAIMAGKAMTEQSDEDE
ncbi:hypothetical protein [Rhizobium sp. Root482]|uniref:hypothetical protein n=1 Tax=Rhizobium sp. Root482 TaxID=1736543 RepID=UPI000AF28140|nr:hypothetical protein [Rhizobium sp. Root482]